MKLNITNMTPRLVVCNQVQESDNIFPNASLLKMSQVYHLVKMDVFKWNTDVYLREFPGKIFNSAMFEEYPTSQEKLERKIALNGRTSRCIAILSGSYFPKLRISEYSILLEGCAHRLKALKEGEVFVIGRNQDCDVTVSSTDITVSRIHCYITRTPQGLKLFDCSLTGTIILF